MDLETVRKLHEQYEMLKASIKSEKLGTETEPKWEHSSVKSTFDEMLETIKASLQKIDKNHKCYYRLTTMEGALYYQQAKVLVQLGEMEKAENILKKNMESLKDLLLIPEVTFLGLRVLNHYCYLLTKNGDLVGAQQYLELAEEKYLELKHNDNKSSYTTDDLFADSFDIIHQIKKSGKS